MSWSIIGLASWGYLTLRFWRRGNKPLAALTAIIFGVTALMFVLNLVGA